MWVRLPPPLPNYSRNNTMSPELKAKLLELIDMWNSRAQPTESGIYGSMDCAEDLIVLLEQYK